MDLKAIKILLTFVMLVEFRGWGAVSGRRSDRFNRCLRSLPAKEERGKTKRKNEKTSLLADRLQENDHSQCSEVYS